MTAIDKPRKRTGADIAADFDRIIQTMCPDGEVTPEVEMMLAEVEGDITSKAEAYQYMNELAKADATSLRTLKDKLGAKIKAAENRQERYVALCEQMLRIAGLDKVRTALGTPHWHPMPDKIDVLDETVFCATHAGKQYTLTDGRVVDVVKTTHAPKLALLGELHRAGIDIAGLGARVVECDPVFRLR